MAKRSFMAVCTIVVVGMTIAVAIGAYRWGRNMSAGECEELKMQLADLQAVETDAAVVKRVSQQMEDIAYQQKEISDRQRMRAEEQTALALQMRARAEQESKVARQAEEMAVLAAREADEQRVNALIHQQTAELQRDEATLAKSITDTLSFRTLGRTLGISALSQYENKNYEIANMLAYTSWLFIDQYEGNTYLTESFKAIATCVESVKEVPTVCMGSMRSVCVLPDRRCVLASDYGELDLLHDAMTADSIIVRDNTLNFRDVYGDGQYVYALSLHGPLCIFAPGKPMRPLELPGNDTYLKLMPVDDNKLLIAGRYHLYWLDMQTQMMRRALPLVKPLSTLVNCEHTVMLFFEDGTCARASQRSNTLEPFASPTPNRFVSAYYSEEQQRLFLGTTAGTITMTDPSGKYIATLYGHSSIVNDMTVVGDIMVSTAYDKSVILWNLPKLYAKLHEIQLQNSLPGQKPTQGVPEEWLIPAAFGYSEWPMSVRRLNNKEVIVGFSNGKVRRMNVDIADMATQLKERIRRNFSESEWELYIGGNVPYKPICER